MKWTTFGGIVFAAVLLAGAGDLLAHPQGTQTAFNGLNQILGTSYTAASGGYTK